MKWKEQYWWLVAGLFAPGIIKYMLIGECNWNRIFHPDYRECRLRR